MKFQQTCVWELKGIHGLCGSYVCPHLLWFLDFSFRTWCYSDFKTLQRRQPPSEESWEKAAGFTFVLQALVACSPWCSAQRCGLRCASLAASCCFHSVSRPPTSRSPLVKGIGAQLPPFPCGWCLPGLISPQHPPC